LIGCFTLIASFVGSFGVAIYVAAEPSVAIDFKVNFIIAILPISLYAWGIGIGSLFATAFCEVFGRKIIYRITFPLAFIFTIMGAEAKNFTTLAIARMLAGIFSGPCVTVGVGVLNDLWDLSLDKTGTAFSVFYALFLILPIQVAPMASCALLDHHSWRWTFWVSAIMIGFLFIVSFFFPETYEPQILKNRAKKENLPIESQKELFKKFLIAIGRPLHMIIVEPLIIPSGLVMAINQSITFAYYIIYAIVFKEVYGFSQYDVGMAFSPLLVGSILGIPIIIILDKLTYQKARERAIALRTTVHPETRLYPAMLGVILLPISLFWLAWSARRDIHWIAPILSGILFGLCFVLNMLCMAVYNNDVYTIHYGASVMAATTFIRCIISSCFPLFTEQMVRNLGFRWAISLLGFIAIAMIPIPWVFFKWGPALRRNSRYTLFFLYLFEITRVDFCYPSGNNW